jgi:UDP-galactopyranose mutase
MTTATAGDEWAGMDISVRQGNGHDPSWFAGIDSISQDASYDLIIVGAGISGCVFASRASRELGLRSLLIDKRDHVGGNCYDFINAKGFRVSQYGVHLFHTKNARVWEYVNRFSEWIPYEHRVKAAIEREDGEYEHSGRNYRIVSVPPNRDTINALFPGANLRTDEETKVWLDARRSVNEHPKNGEESAQTRAGQDLYEAIFKYYTKKQWDKYPEELDASVLARIPVRENDDDRYFSDEHQALPKDGYTQIFENMIMGDPNITIRLNTDFFVHKERLQKLAKKFVVFTGPIDTWYASQGLPKLEYRSLRFVEEYHEGSKSDDGEPFLYQPCLQLNYPGPEVKHTRIIEYKHKPNQPPRARKHRGSVIFKEYSCDYGEPYYPVPNPANRELYERYRALANNESDVIFVGRLASYKYFNMDQAFLNALEIFDDVMGICGGENENHEKITSEGDGPITLAR